MKILLNKRTASPGVLKKALKTNNLHLTIEFDEEEIIGLTEVKRLMAVYKNMLILVKSGNARESITGQLDFRLFNRIKNFDLTFIAALNLIKFSFQNIKINLNFDRLTENSEEGECFFRFGHFLTASSLAYGHEIYSIKRDDKVINTAVFLENLSGYLPFIYVKADNFEKLFHKAIKSTWDEWWGNLKPKDYENLNNKKNNAEKIYQQLRELVIKKIDLNGDPEQNILNLYIIYLFNAVRKFHFIKKVLKNQSEKAMFKEAGIDIDESVSALGIGLSREADQKYGEKVQKVFYKILEKPPAFVMLFSYFIEKFYSQESREDATYPGKIKSRIELISNIFYFTDEIFYGIRELAKNIIEHSSKGRGVIIGRVLDRKYLPELKRGMNVEPYLKSRPDFEKEFIDLIVLDDGDRGIIGQTIKNLETLEKEFKGKPEFLGKFKRDIENLTNDKIVLPDFFNPEDIKLNYQEIRSALSLGLLIFSHLVLENNGYMMASSPHKGKVQGLALFDNWGEMREMEEIIPLGTFYNILFPKNLKRPPAPRSETVPFEMPSGESAFNKLFKLINCKDIEKRGTLPGDRKNYEDRLCFIDYRHEVELKKDDIQVILEIFKKCSGCTLQKNRKILSIDFKRASKLDASALFRFLAKIQMIKDIKGMIVHNVKYEIVSRIIEIFEIFRKVDFKIGSSDHFVLFYYLTEGKRVDYYSFLLGGESWGDLSWLNKKIAKTNYTESLLQKQENDSSCEPSPQFQKDYCLNPMFTAEGHLLPFDVVIKRSGLTLFERNVLSNMTNLEKNESAPRYIFKDAHMRLGSKIHLKDFFYAGRIFQNSFYSLRFAYLVSRYIQSNIVEWLKNNQEQNTAFTLVGYGLYSELLVSNVTRFLKGMYENWDIGRALIADVETLKLVGEVGKKNILIIPISSTLSTSLKIEMRLNEAYPDSQIIGLPINVMIVGNGELKYIIDEKGIVTDKTVGNFWKHVDIDKKTITTRLREKQEKFFLNLPSKWYLPHNCELCFPVKPVEETVLFETDKVSVTPSLIFELPPSKKPTPFKKNIHFGEYGDKTKAHREMAVLTENMLLYSHTTRGNNHYLYYIETTDFLKGNRELLMGWLSEVKDELKKKTDIFESKVVLIAPAHFTNADFINLVNEMIFNDVATLFHYDQNEDYIQNLKSFFGGDITKDSYVFFIDDAVSTGSTFEKINNFVKYARSGGYSRGLDGAFVLINRLTQDKYSILVKEVDEAGFFAFIDLDVPIMIDSERFCHLCSEKKRYKKMLSETALDSLRVLIRAKIMKLEENKYKSIDKFDTEEYRAVEWKYIKKEKCNFFNKKNEGNYLKRLEFVHKLYRGFFDEKVKIKIEKIFKNDKSLEDLCKEGNIVYSPGELSEDEKVNLIKVLSYPYFVYHKEIRKYIFRVVILELEQTIRTLLEIPEDRNLEKKDFDTYRYLKFLIKRAAMLKANYLIRHEILEKIIALTDMLRERLQKEEDNNRLFLPSKIKEEFLENLDGFIDYYVMAVKEVTWFNEAKSLKLEETLNSMQSENDKSGRTFLLLRNSLRMENISIPYQFLQFLVKLNGKTKLSFTEKSYELDIIKLSTIFIQYCRRNPYRSTALLSLLGFEGEIIDSMETFLEKNSTFKTKILPMILLKSFFLAEKGKKGEKTRIKLKMDYILFCLCKILDIDTKTGGAFFVVKYMEEADRLLGANLFTIGHIGKKKEIYDFDWGKSYTSKMFDANDPSFQPLPLTYVQILEKNGGFCTQFGANVETGSVSEIEKLEGMRSFLFLRIADDDLDNTTRGVFVFYINRAEVIPPENLRCALILKNDILDFLEKNYEDYSFKLWYFRRQKTSYEVTRQLSQAQNTDDLQRNIVKNIREIFQAEKCSIFFFNKEKDLLERKAIHLLKKDGGTHNVGFEESYKRGTFISGKVYERGEPVLIEDLPVHSPKNEEIIKQYELLLQSGKIKNTMFAPMTYKNDKIGIIRVANKLDDHYRLSEIGFTQDDLDLLVSLGSQVAIAINNRVKQEKQMEIFKDISHTLGTYLTTMRLYSQRIIEGKVKGKKKKKYLKILFGDVLSMANSVDEISSLAKMEFWDASSISGTVEISEIIETIASKNEFLLNEKQLKLYISGTGEKVYVKADKNKLEDALQSLINNSIKFSEENKNINISILTEPEFVIIEIKDEGYGIHKDDLDKIFLKYERGRIAKEKKITGTGIGLAAAKNIIDKHSGDMTVVSELGKGSTFTIKLPVFKKEDTK